MIWKWQDKTCSIIKNCTQSVRWRRSRERNDVRWDIWSSDLVPSSVLLQSTNFKPDLRCMQNVCYVMQSSVPDLMVVFFLLYFLQREFAKTFDKKSFQVQKLILREYRDLTVKEKRNRKGEERRKFEVFLCFNQYPHPNYFNFHNCNFFDLLNLLLMKKYDNLQIQPQKLIYVKQS